MCFPFTHLSFRNIEPVPEPVENPLAPHGRAWTEVPNVAVEVGVGNRYAGVTSLQWQRLPEYNTSFADRTEFDYFRLLFPWQHIDVILTNTNNSIAADPNSTGGPVDLATFLRYLGIQLAKAVDPSPGGNNTYWSTDATIGSTVNPKCFNKRFGMSRNRFDTITQHLHFSTPATPNILQVYGCVILRKFCYSISLCHE